MQKRIAAIHDISCFGKCSLTAAMPIISAAGIEVCVIPTAVLSTHTGGFAGFTYRDLTDDLLPIATHLSTLPIKFDAIYTGFLGSFKQLDIAARVIKLLGREDALVVVDPVMADNGALYQTMPKDFPEGMRGLCARADMIVPNITEAALLLDEPYKRWPHTQEYVESLLLRLAKLGPRYVVLTGTGFDDKHMGAAAYDKQSGSISYAFSKHMPGLYHGAGDVFSSALVAAALSGFGIKKAVRTAADFTAGSIRRTNKAGTDLRFGLCFEPQLPRLIKTLGRR
ncbi:MAG: pyridoxamine kinase [Christensenellales bacterium]